ncbi:glycosyltransferase family 2 protein [Patescibacteria group bacterium]|nr:glycosyltransferase family 2 protein [Patescibacteria group bacterium]
MISIIIVSWNTRNLLKKCLESIFTHVRDAQYEVIVIDNASQDGTVEMVRGDFPNVKFIANDKNLGFAKANNQGIREAHGEYILLLNPDTEFIEDALTPVLRKMESDEKIGVLGCKLLNSDKTLQPSVRRFPRKRDVAIILLKLHKLFPSLLDHYLARGFSAKGSPRCEAGRPASGWDYSREQEVGQVMGAFFLVRKEVFDKIGFLDERYFIWFEEVDFCRRVWQYGWKVVYYPNASIVHHHGQSFAQAQTWQKQLWFFHSAWRYFFKGERDDTVEN